MFPKIIIMLMMVYLCGDCTVLILVKDREGLLEGGQVVRGQRFKDPFSVSFAKSCHTTWKCSNLMSDAKKSKLVDALSKTVSFANLGGSTLTLENLHSDCPANLAPNKDSSAGEGIHKFLLQ